MFDKSFKNKLVDDPTYKDLLNRIKKLKYRYESVDGHQLNLTDAIIDEIEYTYQEYPKMFKDKTSDDLCQCAKNMVLGYYLLLRSGFALEDYYKDIGNGDDDFDNFFCINLYEDTNTDRTPIVCATLELEDHGTEQIWISVQINDYMFSKISDPTIMLGDIAGTSIQDEVIELYRFKGYVTNKFDYWLQNRYN